ncbi:MAG: DUF1573 domain-containing protein [Bacteroidota bacterium]
MKLLSVKMLILAVIFGAAMTSCDDKDAEKKIAELESRLADLEGTPAAAKPATATKKVEPTQKPDGPLPIIEWEATQHDFGTISQGDKVNYKYKFKNTGAIPLIIETVRPSCGCTAPNWSKEPIPVGGEGFVEVNFDSNKYPNAQNKTVTVTANTWPQATVLRFKAFVTPAAK